MKFSFHRLFIAAVAALSVGFGTPAFAAAPIDYVQPQPLHQAVKDLKLKPVKSGNLRVPVITWPGDVSTIYAVEEGVFKSEGLNVDLFLENDVVKQVQGVINGETPFFRGTMGMVNAAAEAFEKSGTEMVVIYQLTWSAGGDCLVVRPGVKNLTDLKGKTIVAQLYGPHMDFITTTLERGGLKPSDVKLKFVKELTIPTYDTKGRIVDPRSAFEADASIDAATVISPDASAITSSASGAEGVKGATTLFSSKTVDHVIADVYAVRKDWFDANRGTVEKFVHALMVGQEKFEAAKAAKASNQAKFTQLMQKSADVLFGTTSAAGDVEASLADCAWVGYQGNVQFFTGAGTTRNFAVLNGEIQSAFTDIKLMTSAKAAIANANWDYTKLATGLKNVDLTKVPQPKFDAAKVQQHVEATIATELATWESNGLYFFEIYFAPRAAQFDATQYSEAFEQALKLSQTLGGAIVTIEGHNAPDAYTKAKNEGKSAAELGQIEQAAKNLSYERANAVRKAYLDFCTKKGLTVDPSQFAAVGLGVKLPKFAIPANKQQWDANRRVVFRVTAVETEEIEFKGGN